MTNRTRLDDMTDDALDQLYAELNALRTVARGYCPACGRGDAAPTVADWEQQKQRADRAEAAIARVRAVADRWQQYGGNDLRRYTSILLAALNQPTPTTTPQTTSNSHS